ncbi:HAD-like domain-containing protein [Lasiosphaeria ovina]|uniref:HAD-like domain-containing protein n=1 Tax=Lasiosphaeria ovina TaxID=92902 RepID=A0AAE0MZZ1_9PEZI|nr:HAD-like domain-containing protein [Lasiosphaeria ovina]
MNSLNIISARVSPASSPAPTRTNSLNALSIAVSPDDDRPHDADDMSSVLDNDRLTAEPDVETWPSSSEDRDHAIDENTPLLPHSNAKPSSPRGPPWSLLPKRIANTFTNSIRWVLSTLAAPGVYLIACLYDHEGNFAPLSQLRKLFGLHGGNVEKMAVEYHESMSLSEKGGQVDGSDNSRARASRFLGSSGSSSSGLSSESDSDPDRRRQGGSRTTSGRHLRSKSLQDSEEIAPARRSIRIRLHSDDTLRQRKHRKAQSASARSNGESSASSNDISAHLKSPTSPVGALTKYPKTPAPPRPLIPRRQPSYINIDPASLKHQKTLILDLDETLIHSMSKGGRMSTGHMVEVKLSTTYVGVGGQASIGPQHPILYYVHKRPHCDEFLRRVSKWFNLVVFTASVQEYADPVIDWLESDRKYFSARYYRQHCTFRHGAFIKDLSSVEPDLSKVMILDNSPLSYMFHQDNAIPIQGWISDPTDGDLMYLIPFLEGLQYVSDVRALLALRGGEDGQHMA